MALHNLGIRYSELGRPREAIAPVEEAVATYRSLAGTNPAFLPNLASALGNLTHRCREAGDPERAEAAWRTVIAGFNDPAAQAFLRLRQAQGPPTTTAPSTTWRSPARSLRRPTATCSRTCRPRGDPGGELDRRRWRGGESRVA